jgi:hypothetical protein
MKSKIEKRKEALARMERRIEKPVPEGQDKRVKQYPRSVEARDNEMANLRKKIGSFS